MEEGSPAAKAGIKENDVLLELNGAPVNGDSEVGRLVRAIPPGRKVKLKLLRDGATLTSTVTLAARPVPQKMESADIMRRQLDGPEFFMSDMPAPALRWRNYALGLEYEPVDSQLADFFGVKQGVLIRAVRPGSPAQNIGLRAGDVIEKIGATAVATAQDLSSTLRNERTGKSIPIHVVRDHKTQVLKLNVADVPGPIRSWGRPALAPQE